MTENMKKYLEIVSKDKQLEEELKEMQQLAVEEQKQTLVDHAAKLGVVLEEHDLDLEQSVELSDDELEDISGGSAAVTITLSVITAAMVLLKPIKVY